MQRRDLGRAEQMNRASRCGGRRSVVQLHDFHGVLRQGLVEAAGGAAQPLAFAVRQLDNLMKHRALARFQPRGACVRKAQFAAQPFLNERVLTMVLVISNEPGKSIGELPGAAPGIALELRAGADVLVQRL